MHHMQPRAIGLVVALAAAVLIAAASPGAQSAPQTLTIAGDVGTPLSLTPDALKALPRTRVEVEEDGRTVGYEGVLVGELLKRGTPPTWGSSSHPPCATSP